MIVLSAVALAMLLVILEPLGDLHLVERWPLFFGASPSSASGLLTTVASSMITVAGVVFSITLVALSLTASQYTPRLIRNFMRDRVFDDVDEAMTAKLNAAYVLNRQRTLEQDATFGIRQIVDIALKALSLPRMTGNGWRSDWLGSASRSRWSRPFAVTRFAVMADDTR